MEQLINRIIDVIQTLPECYQHNERSRLNLQRVFKYEEDFMYIGAGNFCTVFLHKPTDSIVKFVPTSLPAYKEDGKLTPYYKLNLNTDTERMVEYLQDCMELQKEWMPKVHSMFCTYVDCTFEREPSWVEMWQYKDRLQKPRRRGTKVPKPRNVIQVDRIAYTVTITERLQPIYDKQTETYISDEIRTKYKNIEKCLPERHTTITKFWDNDWRRYLKRCLCKATSDQFAREIRRYLFDFCNRSGTDGVSIDLSNENVMLRGTQLVINDPIY